METLIRLFLAILLALPFPAHSQWDTDRGLGRIGAEVVKIPDAKGRDQSLYDESHALIVGISRYTNGWPSLPGVKEDVREVARVLKSHGFRVTVKEDLLGSELDREIRTFIAHHGRNPDNRLLFYFAGHGYTLELGWGGDMGYFVPADAPSPRVDEIGFESTALAMQRVQEYAKRIHSKHALFIFDSCFSGSLFATRGIPQSISYKTAQPVRQFITSGSANEQVPDVSVFRHKLVEALEGEGDIDGNGYVTGGELGEFLQQQVIDNTHSAQHPQWGTIQDAYLNKGDFVFQLAPKPKPVEPSPGQPNPMPPPPAVAGNLQVFVNTANDARIYVDDQFMGTASKLAPFTRSVASPTGFIEVRVEANGFEPQKRQVQIIPNQWSQQVFQMAKQSSAAAPPPPKPLPDPRAAQRQRADGLVEKAVNALLRDHLTSPKDESAVERLRQALEVVPDYEPAIEVLGQVIVRYQTLIDSALRIGNLDLAQTYLKAAQEVVAEFQLKGIDLNDQARRIADARQESARADSRLQRINTLVDQAYAALVADRLVAPPEDSALHYAEAILAIEPDHQVANGVIEQVLDRLKQLARQAIERADLAGAGRYAEAARSVAEGYSLDVEPISVIEDKISAVQVNTKIGALARQAEIALGAGRLNGPGEGHALALAEQIQGLAPGHEAAREIARRVVDELLQRASLAVRDKDLAQAGQGLAEARAIAARFTLDAPALDAFSEKLAEARARVAAADSRAKQIENLTQRASAALAADQLLQPNNAGAVHYAREILTLAPEHQGARRILEEAIDRLLQRAGQAVESDQLPNADDLVEEAKGLAQEFGIDAQRLAIVEGALAMRREAKARQAAVANLLAKAKAALARNHLTTPARDNAFDYLREALEIGAGQNAVQELADQVVSRYVGLAERSLARQDFDQAGQFAQSARRVSQAFSIGAERVDGVEGAIAEIKTNAQINEWTRQASAALRAGRLVGPGEKQALAYAERIRKLDPGHEAAREIAQRVVEALRLQSEELIRDRSFDEAEDRLNEAKATATVYSIEEPGLGDLAEGIAQGRAQPIAAPPAKAVSGVSGKLKECQGHMQADALTTPIRGRPGTALSCYRDVLAMDPGNAEARAGLDKIADKYIGWITSKLARKDTAGARGLMERLALVDPSHPRLGQLNDQADALDREAHEQRQAAARRAREKREMAARARTVPEDTKPSVAEKSKPKPPFDPLPPKPYEQPKRVLEPPSPPKEEEPAISGGFTPF